MKDSQLKGFLTLKVSISVSGYNSSQDGHRDMKLSATDAERHGDTEALYNFNQLCLDHMDSF